MATYIDNQRVQKGGVLRMKDDSAVQWALEWLERRG